MNITCSLSRCFALLTLAAIIGGLDAPANADGWVKQHGMALQPRSAMPKPEVIARPDVPHRLTVKFRDDLRARATDAGAIVSEAGLDVETIDVVRREHDVVFAPLIRLPEETLHHVEHHAAARSGTAQPDLGGMMIVNAPDAALQDVADALLASPLTEWVYFQELAPPPPTMTGTPCEDIAPLTPDYLHMQTYHGPDPGLNMTAAWAMADAARGQGIRIADCEYWYNPNHEDLCDIIPEPGQTPHPDIFALEWDEHGTAVFGELIAAENEYGCTGLVPDAEGYFFPEWTVEEGFRRVTAITNAIATMDVGDIVLLEMQTFGPGGGFGPAELDPAVWQVTKAGTDGGVVVVAAAGNGNQNLDSPAYAEYMGWGDSGAIIVGAGSSNTGHNKLNFSTYGSRVNVQGWGQNVFTLGYGDFAEHGGDKNQRYTAGFGGTSSASPFIAAAAAALQGVAESELGYRLEPLTIREILIETGIPQGSGGHIGPFPDMVAAVEAVLEKINPADLNGDGTVDVLDLIILLEQWGTCDDCGECPADFDGSCTVDVQDLLFLLENWG